MVPGRQLFLLPDAIPAARMVRRWAQTQWRSPEPCAHGKPPLAAVTRRQACQALGEALERIGTEAWIGTGQEDPSDDAHDRYFRIQRVNAEAAPAFLRMLLAARLLLLREAARMASEGKRPMLAEIDVPLAELIGSLLLEEGGRIATPVTDWEWPPEPAHLPLQRWIVGHQIFAAITQALILIMDSLRAAIRAGLADDVRQAAEEGQGLLRATSMAFALTADFAPEEYESVIRPTMAPPFTSVSLSGLMSVDHRVLVQQMRDMRPAFRALAEHEPALHEELAKALGQVYDQHILVCQRFVGSQPSLLVAGKSEKSGPELIAQFKTLRQKPFDYQPKAGPPMLLPARCPMSEQIKNTFYAALRSSSD